MSSKILMSSSERCVPRTGLSVLVLLVMLAVMTGCDSTSPPAAPHVDPGYIEGYATGQSSLAKGSGVEGAMVTVAEIQADGSLHTITQTPVETNALGYYRIVVDKVGSSNLVVIATKNGHQAGAMVASEVKSGQTIQAPPITFQSTVETEVYATAVASGQANLVTIADLRAYIDDVVANDVSGNATAIVVLATAIGAEAQARSEAYASSEIGATQDQVNTIRRQQLEALLQLDATLHARWNDPNGTQLALSTFLDAIASANTGTGLEVDRFAEARIAAMRAMLRWSRELSAETRFRLEKRSAALKANLMDRVCKAKFQAAGATATQLAAVVSAGATLKANVNAASTSQQLVQAFESYHNSIVNWLSLTLAGYASAIVSVDADINGANGLKAQLEAQIEAAMTARQITAAYMQYYSNVRNAVLAAMPGATEVELRAVASVLMLVNLY
jgi:hypothetical protein